MGANDASGAAEAETKWSIAVKPGVDLDVYRIALWYESQQSGLAEQMLSELEDAAQQIADYPERRMIVYGDVRRFVTRRFHCAVFYKIVKGEPLVIAVIDARRDPDLWPPTP